MSDTSGAPDARRGPRHRGALIALGAVVALAGVGVFLVHRYEASEVAIAAALNEMKQRGQSLEPEGCVDETLAWNARCTAMKSLCDASVPRVMLACLGAKDRSEYCANLGDRSSDTGFGYAECKARGLQRSAKKMCALTYRAIDGFCKQQPASPAGGAEAAASGDSPAAEPAAGTGP